MIDSEELVALQELALPFMTTLIEIYRPKVRSGDPDAPEYVAEYDYGDDQIDNPDAEPPDEPVIQPASLVPLRGWFFAPPERDFSVGSAQIGTIDTHQVRLPVGTNIRPYDIIRRVDNGETYVVVDPADDDTWPDMLHTQIRKRDPKVDNAG